MRLVIRIQLWLKTVEGWIIESIGEHNQKTKDAGRCPHQIMLSLKCALR